MREIKFRLWDEKSKRFADTWNQLWILGALHGDKLVLCLDEIEEGRFSIEQYTGLLDKNGKEIYEGDIVRVKVTQTQDLNIYGDTVKEGIVRYDDEHPLFTLKANFMNFVNWSYNDEIEVIGNIHDTKEGK